MRTSSPTGRLFWRRTVKAQRDETAWPLHGGLFGVFSWLLAIGAGILFYGAAGVLILFYTWPLFMALLPVAVLLGAIFNGLAAGRWGYSFCATALVVLLLYGGLLHWLLS